MSGLFWKIRNGILEALARGTGRFVYNRRVAWLTDQGWLDPYRSYLDRDRNGQEPSTRILDRRFTLINFARSVRDLDGSTAECGVYRGVGSALICKALDGTYRNGQKHLGFDSFAGVPAPTAPDQAARQHVWEEGYFKTLEAETRTFLAGFPQCELIQGWIPACFEPASGRSFRLVHIDVDLYEPTKASLEFFYPRMVDRGVLLFDDYGHVTCPGARKAIDDFFRSRPEKVVELTCGQAFVIRTTGRSPDSRPGGAT
jgi:hypothetical protein